MRWKPLSVFVCVCLNVFWWQRGGQRVDPVTYPDCWIIKGYSDTHRVTAWKEQPCRVVWRKKDEGGVGGGSCIRRKERVCVSGGCLCGRYETRYFSWAFLSLLQTSLLTWSVSLQHKVLSFFFFYSPIHFIIRPSVPLFSPLVSSVSYFLLLIDSALTASFPVTFSSNIFISTLFGRVSPSFHPPSSPLNSSLFVSLVKLST